MKAPVEPRYRDAEHAHETIDQYRARYVAYDEEVAAYQTWEADAIPPERERDAYRHGRQAVLPDEGGDEGGMTSLMGLQGDLPEHPFDRFTRYESLGAFLRACVPVAGAPATGTGQIAGRLLQGPLLDPLWEGMGAQDDPKARVSFTVVRDFLLGGWPEGAARIEEAMSAVTPPPAMDLRRRGAWSDGGEELVTDRLYEGSTEPWRTTRKRFTHGPQRVRIVVDIGSTCAACGTIGHNAEYLDARALFWRGAAAASLADNLETAGYRVEVISASGTVCTGLGLTMLGRTEKQAPERPAHLRADENTERWVADYRQNGRLNAQHNTVGIATVVKDFASPVDVSVIAAGTAAAVTYRRATFLNLLVNKHPKEIVDSCFGALASVEYQPRMRRELGLDEEGVATVFVSHWVLTQKLANAWARGALWGIESVRTGSTIADMQDMQEEEDEA